MGTAFTIQIDQRGRCSVVRCSGRAVLNQGIDRLQDAVARQLEEHRSVVLDFSEVIEVDARAIGVLADLSRRALTSGRRLAIAGAEARVHQLLHLTGLDMILSGDLPLEPREDSRDARVGVPQIHAAM